MPLVRDPRHLLPVWMPRAAGVLIGIVGTAALVSGIAGST
jgi:hypothetical protein